MCLGHNVLHGLEALLRVYLVYAQQINCRPKINRFASFKGFPRSVGNIIINKILNTLSILQLPWRKRNKQILINLNKFNGVQHIFDLAKLTASLISDRIVDDVQEPRTYHINLVQINTKVIDRHKNWFILLLTASKVKENKLILNPGLKASNELKLPWTDSVNHLWINLCKVLIVAKFAYVVLLIFIFSESGFE